MEYEQEVRAVAQAHFDEIVGDLDRARHDLAKRRGETAELERRIAQLESLVALVQPDAGDSSDDGMTLHEAMREVLKSAPGGLRAGDLAAEINRRRLYRMRDGRPVEAQQIHARVGSYGHLFRKVGTFIVAAE
jgi:hypothetical protein